jgi:hypothetical protein
VRDGRKEGFFNIDLPYLPRAVPTMIVGGDLKCVFAKKDVRGHFNYSRALNEPVHGFDLLDIWETAPERGDYTH